MQKILRWSGSISQYKEEYENMRMEKPKQCQQCKCTKIYKWGKYERYTLEKDGSEELMPIKRFYCVGCGKTYSYLPSFCVSRACYSVDLIMTFLKAFILKIQYEFNDMKRRAYTYLRRFRQFENLWITYLRSKGIGDIPTDKKQRQEKIFTCLLELYDRGNLMEGFLEKMGRYFMSAK
jgi:hypothetical protein